MINKRFHLVVSLVVLATYLLNMAAVAGGTVLCDDPVGVGQGGLVGLTFDGGHCEESVGHDHSGGEHPCWCSSCPCEDTPIAMDQGTPPRYEKALDGLSDLALPVVHVVSALHQPCDMAVGQLLGERWGWSANSRVNRVTLRQLCTLVLIL